jgi:hypothetical protein
MFFNYPKAIGCIILVTVLGGAAISWLIYRLVKAFIHYNGFPFETMPVTIGVGGIAITIFFASKNAWEHFTE